MTVGQLGRVHVCGPVSGRSATYDTTVRFILPRAAVQSSS